MLFVLLSKRFLHMTVLDGFAFVAIHANLLDRYKYDEHNGEITYEYSFLTRHGIFKDDLETYFYAVVGSAVSCYDDIRKCSVGRYKSKEANEIIQKVNAIVSDIKE